VPGGVREPLLHALLRQERHKGGHGQALQGWWGGQARSSGETREWHGGSIFVLEQHKGGHGQALLGWCGAARGTGGG